MGRQLTYAIVADGGTDRVLQPIIDHSIRRLDTHVQILEPDFDKRHGSIGDYLQRYRQGAMLVFAHRDAEASGHDARLEEFTHVPDQRVVPVIPVKMTEAWLLIDPTAIARAAGRPGASVDLPPIHGVERLRDPKALLEQLLLTAAGDPSGRRRDQFKRKMTAHRVNVASYITDFSRLDALPAYSAFMDRLRSAYPYASGATDRSKLNRR